VIPKFRPIFHNVSFRETAGGECKKRRAALGRGAAAAEFLEPFTLT